MSPRTEKQYEIIRAEKQELIKEAALELFANEGYHATSISKIARKAGISKGLLYNYFEGKEDLLKQLFRDSANMMFDYFDPNHDDMLTRQEFFFFIRQNIRVVKENIQHWKLYSALVLQPAVLSLVEHDFDDMGNKMIIMLRKFFSDNNLNDPDGEILLFTALLKGAVIQYVATPQFFPIDLFEQKIIDMYTEKLKK